MARIGLSLYLMLAALAGPCFCCCSAERLTALFAPPMKQASCARCCGNHQYTTGYQHRRTPEQRPGNEQPNRPSCPCQEHGRQQVPLVSVDSELAKHLQFRYSTQGPAVLLLAALASLSSIADCDPEKSGENGLLPFLSAQDILCALHILRC